MTTLRVYRAETRRGHRFGVLFARDPRGRSVYVLDDAHMCWTMRDRLRERCNLVEVDYPASRVMSLADGKGLTRWTT